MPRDRRICRRGLERPKTVSGQLFCSNLLTPVLNDLLRSVRRGCAGLFLLVLAAFAHGLFDQMVDTVLYAGLEVMYCGTKCTGYKIGS